MARSTAPRSGTNTTHRGVRRWIGRGARPPGPIVTCRYRRRWSCGTVTVTDVDVPLPAASVQTTPMV